MMSGTATHPESIPATLEQFRLGSDEAVNTVRGWVSAVVHGGRWRLPDAEGMVQDVLLILLDLVRRDKVRDAQAFQRFVYNTAKNQCIKAYYRARRREDHEEPESEFDAAGADPDPHDRLERQEQFWLTAYIFQRLSEACRELWTLVYYEGLSAEETGQRLGIHSGNVRVRVHRCLERARDIYREHSEGAA
ncbi:hypothetical protein ABI59_06650 [Acidobacteria bacterium Mor1]|nr:hypothetical protein ABI59_06650 [Acidobacteria bacterium Mor1]